MKIFVICSKHFYNRIPEIEKVLNLNGHELIFPNSYGNPFGEDKMREKPLDEYQAWKKGMFRESQEKVKNADAVLVLNFEKNGIKNYVGGATFLEMYDAFRKGKTIFLHNPVPEGMLFDEITGFSPVIINGDLNLIR